MKNLKYVAFALFLGFVAISCGDDDSDAPIVNLTSPAEGSTYTAVDTIFLTASVTEDTKLESIVITSDLIATETISSFDSDTSHVLNYIIPLDSTIVAGDYMFTVAATDDAGNEGTDQVNISLQ